MQHRGLSAFHALCADLDYRAPLDALLAAFQSGQFADPERTLEASAIETHFGDLCGAWDQLFPAFPEVFWIRRSVMWENARGKRDEYLQKLIIEHVDGDSSRDRLIVNPATTFGRHAMSQA